MYIFIFGVVGTLISFSVIAPLTYLSNQAGLFKFTFMQNYTNSTNLTDTNNKITTIRSNQKLNWFTIINSTNDNLLEYTYTLRNLYKETREYKIDLINQGSQEQEHIFSFSNVPNVKNNHEVLSSNSNSSYELYFSLSEILLFSSVITATDTVSALTFVKETTEPKLFAIMLGEGIVNDAVCIVLYKIIQNLHNTGTCK